MSSNSDAEKIYELRKARTLSTWGPKFDDETTRQAWLEKLKDISLNDLRSALDQLSGHKEFPTVAEILAVAKGASKKAGTKETKSEAATYAMRTVNTLGLDCKQKVERMKRKDEAYEEMREGLVRRILELDELRWIRKFYPWHYDAIIRDLKIFSYYIEFHSKLEDYYWNVNLMLKEVLPGISFDFNPHRKAK